MNAADLRGALAKVSAVMAQNRDYLVELDQQNGDGDLGISMDNGFKAVSDYLQGTDETNLGALLMRASGIFNEKAPSTLGTITSFMMVGMAQTLKGKQSATLEEVARAFAAGNEKIMQRAGSKREEKTILDALGPAADALEQYAGGGDWRAAFSAAAEAARDGSERTRYMLSVHGRAAYYGEKSLGVIDGGSVVGRLLFEALRDYICDRT